MNNRLTTDKTNVAASNINPTTDEAMGIAKPEVGNVEIVDSRYIVQGIASVLAPYAHLHGVDILINESKSGLIKVDKLKLEQVLINIVKNAIEASPEGGAIALLSTVNTPDRSVSIIVEDHGIGMDTEQLSKIGNPFYSTKTTGTGLGLTTSYRLIQAMNGTMDIQSIKGRGTTVSIRLSLIAEKAVHMGANTGMLSTEPVNIDSATDQTAFRPLR